MSSANRIVKNTALLFGTHVLDKGLSLLLVIIITRMLGSEGYGQYAFAFAFVMLFRVIADFGLKIYLMRDLSHVSKEKADALASSILTLQFVLSIVVMSIAFLVASFAETTRLLIGLIVLVEIHELLSVLLSTGKGMFTALERNEFTMGITVLERILPFIFAGTVLLMGYGLIPLLYALIFGKLITLIVNLGTLQRFLKLRFSWQWKTWPQLLWQSLPMWLSYLFITLYYQVDRIMLGAMSTFKATGLYTSASSLTGALSFLPLVITFAIFPSLSRLHAQKEKKMLGDLYKKAFYYLVVISIPAAVGIYLLADHIILLIYGSEFLLAGTMLSLLSITLVFLFLNHLMGFMLNAVNKQGLFTVGNSVALLLNIVVNVFLIPLYGGIGAAIATIIAQAVNFILLLIFLEISKFSMPSWIALLKPLVSAAVMGAFVFYVPLNMFLLIPAAILVYFVVLFVLKGWGKDEIALVHSMIQGKP